MSRAPRLVPGHTAPVTPLSAEEVLVLSLVDGQTEVPEIAEITGSSPEHVALILARLQAVGIVAGTGAARAFASGFAPSTSAPSTATEPDDGIDLVTERRRAILALHDRLSHANYYELLSVPTNAEKKAIKQAYYAIAPDYHPDRFFRKRLGSFQPKIEAIFTHLSIALEVLTSPEKRAQYDSEQGIVRSAGPASRATSSVPAANAPRAQVPSEPTPPPFRRSPTPPTSPSPPPRRRAITVDPPTDDERREVLVRKLGRRTPTSPDAAREAAELRASVPPADGASGVRRTEEWSSGDALRSRYEAAKHEVERRQIGRYVEASASAEAKGDIIAASNALRAATALSPHDEGLARRAAEFSQRAAESLAESYMEHGEAAAAQNRWADAALAFSKVCEGRPNDARAFDRACFATLRAGGNPRRAVELGRRAVELAPQSPDFRLTLARAYFAASLPKSAEGEIARAIQLAPNDVRIRELAGRTRETVPKDGS